MVSIPRDDHPSRELVKFLVEWVGALGVFGPPIAGVLCGSRESMNVGTELV